MTDKIIRTLIARQGIYDRKGLVYAYELLYRENESINADVNNNNPDDGDAATSSVITRLFTNLDIDLVIGSKPAFINFTYNHLIRQIPKILPHNRIYIEVLENIPIDMPLIDSLRALKREGYKIALDDFTFDECHQPLIEIADIIKIDVLNQSELQIKKQIAPFKDFKGKLLAEKIENISQYNCCMDLGFEYFQGFYLNKPDPMKGHKLTENKAHLFRVFTELHDINIPLDRVEELILQLPMLSYRILRLANSAALYKGRKMESLMQAINQLGIIQIRNWISLLLISSVDDVVPDLLERTLIRAKMCDNLAKRIRHTNPHLAFTVGIFSTLDAIMNEPMESLLAKIQLSEQINNALLNFEGELGAILKFTVDYETANFSSLASAPLNIHELACSYLDSLQYAKNIIQLI